MPDISSEPSTAAALSPVDHAILTICANPDADHGMILQRLSPDDWQALAGRADEMRIGPLVDRALKLSSTVLEVPPEARNTISYAFKWQSFYALQQTTGLVRLATVLEKEGWSPVFLKGVSLALRDYPEPGLRPMRDVDLLLPPEEAARAQAFLLAHEYYRLAPWATDKTVEPAHHFWNLQDIAMELTIEVHHRLNATPRWQHEHKLIARILASESTMQVSAREIRVTDPITNLLHLVEHATLHHAFDNGPLILADLHYLVRRHQIDWPSLITQARELDLLRPLQLIAEIARAFGAAWIPSELPPRADLQHVFLPAACRAMLQGDELAQQGKMLRPVDPGSGKRGMWRDALWRALHPDPRQLALMAGVGEDSAWRWVALPRWLVDRATKYLAARRNLRDLLKDGALPELQGWLLGEGTER